MAICLARFFFSFVCVCACVCWAIIELTTACAVLTQCQCVRTANGSHGQPCHQQQRHRPSSPFLRVRTHHPHHHHQHHPSSSSSSSFRLRMCSFIRGAAVCRRRGRASAMRCDAMRACVMMMLVYYMLWRAAKRASNENGREHTKIHPSANGFSGVIWGWVEGGREEETYLLECALAMNMVTIISRAH